MTPKELDRWLAENVMGWERYEYPVDDVVLVGYQTENGSLPESQWSPQYDLNQAFVCVEKMREMEYELTLVVDKSGYGCGIENFTESDNEYWEGDDENNPALAICTAIYNALEEQ